MNLVDGRAHGVGDQKVPVQTFVSPPLWVRTCAPSVQLKSPATQTASVLGSKLPRFRCTPMLTEKVTCVATSEL